MPALDVLHPPSEHTVIKPRAIWARPALAVLVIAAPLALGGAPQWTVPLFALFAMASLAVAGWDRSFAKHDRLFVAWVVIVGLSMLQLAPLPPVLLRLLDAESAEASGEVLAALRVSRVGSWRALHHDPGSGLSDLLYFLGLGAAYLASVRVSAREEGDRVVRFVAASALLVALLAVAHQITGQDKLYGIYHPRFAAPPIVSPLLNPNHLAALTGAGAILWLGIAVAADRAASRVAGAISAIFCGIVCMLSLSRGGVAATVGCILLFIGLNARRGASPRSPERRGPPVWGGLALGAAIVLAGLYVASTSLSMEYAHGDTSKLENMRRALGLLRTHWLLGVGSGAAPVAVAAAGRLDPEWTFLRVESLPVDLLVSFGVVAGVAVLVLGLRALRMWWPPGPTRPIVVGAWCAMVSLVAHDLVDFSLFLGGVGYPAAVLAGYLMAQRLRGWGRPLSRGTDVVRTAPVGLLLVGLALTPFAWRSTLECDRDRVEELLRADASAVHGAEVRAALMRHPSDAYLQLLVAAHAAAQNDPSGLRFVRRALELSPHWAQPHLLLARVFAAHGLRSQALVEVREAMLRSSTIFRECAQILARLRPLPDGSEMEHITPAARYGLTMLDVTATLVSEDAAFVASVDEILLRRDSTYFPALRRRAEAVIAEGHPADALVFCDRLVSGHPSLAVGYLCRGNVHALLHDDREALRAYGAGLGHSRDTYDLQIARARLYASERRPVQMREAITAAREAAGSDLERLIRANGTLGYLESSVGNDRGAIEAYLMAHALAAPEMPYLIELVEAASRVGDRPSVEQGCASLVERGALDPRAQAVCGRGPAR